MLLERWARNGVGSAARTFASPVAPKSPLEGLASMPMSSGIFFAAA
jgi:hypothetical protein